MRSSTKIWFLIVVVVLAAAAVSANFIKVKQNDTEIKEYTTNAGELTGDALVGQTFVADADDLSAVSVMFATYSGRDNTAPVYFYLRESYTSDENLRTVIAEPQELGDNQFYRFEFDPIANSKGKTYFFAITSPASVVGNAVTVDLNTQDPYHLGSAFLVRNSEGQIGAEVIARSGKPTVDVAFIAHHDVTLREAIITTVGNQARWVVGTWDTREGTYYNWMILALAAAVVVGAIVVLSGQAQEKELNRVVVGTIIALVMILATLWRIRYAVEMPVTNDEGNYLYDAQTLLRGHLAGGDGYVKAPIMLLWVALWQLIMGPTILAGRMGSIMAGVLTIIPMYFIGREAHNKRTGLLAAVMWGMLGSAAVSTVYVHTQPVAMLFGISGIAVIWTALRGHLGGRKLGYRLLIGGLLLGLGVASRKSILALGIVPLLLVWIESRGWRNKFQRLVLIGAGFLLVISALLGWAYGQYGTQGLWEVSGFNSAEDGQTAIDPAEAEQVREYSIRGMTPFFRESLPLIILALVGVGMMWERWLRVIARKWVSDKSDKITIVIVDHVLPKIGWLLAWLGWWWAHGFFFEYEGEPFLSMGGMRGLWWGMMSVLLIATVWPRSNEEGWVASSQVKASTQPDAGVNIPMNVVSGAQAQFEIKQSIKVAPGEQSAGQMLASALVLLAWFLGLAFFYWNWIKFHANYIIEFLPPLTILAAVGAYWLWRRLFVVGKGEMVRRPLAVISILVIMWAVYLSNYITATFEHTGTFQQDSLREAAEWAQENIPSDKPIFTGAAAVPYLSGHHVSLDIAHPRWYAYEFTRKNPERLNVFLPSAEEMVQAWREAEWVLLEKQTGFSFLMEYSEIEAGMETDFETVHEVENGSNTLVFMHRIKASAV